MQETQEVAYLRRKQQGGSARGRIRPHRAEWSREKPQVEGTRFDGVFRAAPGPTGTQNSCPASILVLLTQESFERHPMVVIHGGSRNIYQNTALFAPAIAEVAIFRCREWEARIEASERRQPIP